MRLDLKSVAYLFISKGFEIYINEKDENSLLVSSLICNECGHPWYMDLTECFFCGMFNTFTAKCPECDEFYSITGNIAKCRDCGEELIYACANPECVSNINDIIYESTLYGKNKGVFNRGSALSTSMSYCIRCGSESNHYETKRAYLQIITDFEELNNMISLDYIDQYNKTIFTNYNDIFIVKTILENKNYYSTNLIKNLIIDNDEVIINDFEESITFDLIYSKS